MDMQVPWGQGCPEAAMQALRFILHHIIREVIIFAPLPTGIVGKGRKQGAEALRGKLWHLWIFTN